MMQRSKTALIRCIMYAMLIQSSSVLACSDHSYTGTVYNGLCLFYVAEITKAVILSADSKERNMYTGSGDNDIVVSDDTDGVS